MSSYSRYACVIVLLIAFYAACSKGEVIESEADDDAGVRLRFSESPSVVTVNVDATRVCGGVAISANVVLTAAQCVDDDGIAQGVANVVLDALNAHRNNGMPQIRKVVAAETHPNYADGHLADLALLLLESDATAFVPISRKKALPGTRLVTIGEAAVAIRVRRSIVVDPSACLEIEKDFDKNTMVCIAGEIPCEGDEGGPVFDERSGNLVAIVSKALPSCKDGDSHIGVVPLASEELLQWIDKTVASLEADATLNTKQADGSLAEAPGSAADDDLDFEVVDFLGGL